MAKVTFRTADGRVVTFTPGKRKNPSDSPRYRSRSATARAVDALDAARRAKKRKAKRAAPKRAVVKRKVVKRVTVKRKTSRKSKAGCRDVKFRGGPRVSFCRPAGSDKARKARKAKQVLGAYSFVKGKALTSAASLKGKKNGQVFVSGGKAYRMISYRSSTGKNVRYALRVKASAK